MNYNISLLRNIALVAIILHHSLCAFGGWPPNHSIGSSLPELMNIVSSVMKNLGLGLFTFISGFVFYYQSRKKEGYAIFLWKKTKRLLLPCLIFAVLYMIIFPSCMFDTWPSPINGTHLWYLPMLFLCIIITSLYFYSGQPLLYIVLSYIITAIIGHFSQVRTFTELTHYYPVFVFGFYSNRLNIAECISKKRTICTVAVAGLLIVWLFIPRFPFSWTIRMACISMVSLIIVTLIRQNTVISSIQSSLSLHSYNIYLMHQFCINTLLAFTDFSSMPFYVPLTVYFLTSLIVPWGLSVAYKKFVS